MGWFSRKKEPIEESTKEPIDWKNLEKGKCEDANKAMSDIANMSRAELKQLVKIRGVPAAFEALYSPEEIAAYLADD